tara:strand:- start:537 stop:899 length:363 start_codon:yes stop_codon:yes gene_type:complete
MPKHENQCNHPPESFYGTVKLFRREGDLYFYVDKWIDTGAYSTGKLIKNEWNYCFRSGPNEHYENGPMHSRPWGYGESLDREDIIESTNEKFELWGHFATFLIRRGQLDGTVPNMESWRK